MLSLTVVACCVLAAEASPLHIDTDVAVYGATPAGVAAAVAAAAAEGRGRRNNVTLLCPYNHVGGMASGGLGWDDIYGVNATDLSPVYGRTSSYAHFAAEILAHYKGISEKAAAGDDWFLGLLLASVVCGSVDGSFTCRLHCW
jgi:hypothetical protein